MNGLAFSGGGIRSAALCSGVLRRLLERDCEFDYLSCVSGGGYTGTAYLDWKYRKTKKSLESKKDWHSEFFYHMRNRAGYICNWQSPLSGLLDTVVILGLMFFANLFIPVIGWGSFASPLALVIDAAFGNILNAARYRCDETIHGSCHFPEDSLAFDRMLLFVIPLVCFVVLHLLSQYTHNFSGLVNLLQAGTGLTLVLTFLPWFINDYLDKTPTLIQVGSLVFSALIWFFLPLLRRYSSLVVLLYCYSYVVYWRVFDKTLFGIQHNEELFIYLSYVSALVLGAASLVGDFYLRVIHVYNRWRLQKAFYTKKSVGKYGCSGITCYDCFPGSYLFTPKEVSSSDDEQALSLIHLKDVKPEYISNVVINGWRKSRNDEEGQTKKYRSLHMSPNGFGIIESQPENQLPNVLGQGNEAYEMPETTMSETLQDVSGRNSSSQQPRLIDKVFDGKLGPGDIKLSSAMAMSAAALSPYLGAYEENEQTFTHILSTLGLEMAATIVYNIVGERNASFVTKVFSYVIKAIFLGLLVFLPIIHFTGIQRAEEWVIFGLTAPFIAVLLLSLPGLVNTGIGNAENDCFPSYTRWLTVHVPLCRFMRAIFNVIATGPTPPAMLHLSDGGHFENLAILPLLKLRLKKIMVVNGGHIASKSSYGNDLIYALQLAREMLNCSFTAMDGGDVLADIQEKLVKCRGNQTFPRKYEFRVHYHEHIDEAQERIKVGEGHVVLLVPREPSTENQEERVIWQDVRQNMSDLEAGWGESPDLTAEEVDRLLFCCCECCNNGCGCHGCCRRISDKVCGTFPRHITGNQFFTPKMFSVYHREGYRACIEAGEFFPEKKNKKERMK